MSVFDPFRMVKRGDWRAQPPEFTEKMPHPIELLRYVMNTGTPKCNGDQECIPMIQKIQQQHLEMGFGDIRYNFMLGDDGTIYEGRGWKCKPPVDPAYADKDGKFVEIAFIGDYRRDIVSAKWLQGPMYNAQWELLYYADSKNYLHKDYDYIMEDDREPRPRPIQQPGSRKKAQKQQKTINAKENVTL
ncbi:peptidoglycan recognition protein 1-like [Macrosteles quadrilineatus]|uniref:peptidoglycan recognition protein 1-like n=1 Tax=Macrosteles quadrilineatus TaxID=74068 RepID=UPI0023E1124A|nr:peptidoglycan recognition protein 1-like [Macrosteles quadrilineatus]